MKIIIIHKNSNNNKNILIFFFNLFLLLIIVTICITSKCNNIERPLLKDEECLSTCTTNEIIIGICKIENDIIKTQWLNNIIYLYYPSFTYLNLAISENNNLYYMISEYPKTNTRLFYLLNNEGYGLLDNNNPIVLKEINDPDKSGRYDSEIFLIKLYESNDNNEYLTSISIADQFIEIYDFEKGIIYFNKAITVFGNLFNLFTYVGVHLHLQSALRENKNTYLIGLLACQYPNGYEEPHFYLNKVNFTSENVKDNPPTYESIDVKCSKARIVSCYETYNFYIVCFYQNENYKYTIIVFDYNLNYQTNLTLPYENSDEGYDYLFFKCIHFFNETGVFGYFDENKKFSFEFKIYYNDNQTIDNQYSNLQQFKLDNYNLNYDKVTISDMIKIEDKKFYFVGVSKDKKNLIIVSMSNYHEDNFAIRIYSINTKNLYDYLFDGKLRIILYKNFLTLGSNYKNSTDYTAYTSLIIFGYPNITEQSLDIYNYLYKHDEIKIYNLSIELKEIKYIIENNIFGYQNTGIEIVENCIDLDDIYLVDLANNKILENYFLPKNEKLKLFIPKQENYFSFSCKFKYAVVVSEPKFSEFNNYLKEYYDTGQSNNEENFFENQKKYYIGKYNYYNIFLNINLTEIGCKDDCEICNLNNSEKCITCKEDNKTCKLKPSEEEDSPNSIKSSYINNNEFCSFEEIIDNNCFHDITIEQANQVYSHIKTNLINSNYTLIKTDNIIFQVSLVDREDYSDNNIISNIDLGQCEIRLKEKYNIPEYEDLIIFQIDMKNLEKSTTYAQYEIYNPLNFERLYLDICSDININIYAPVELKNETLSLFSNLEQSGYNIFNYNDPFYNNFCTPYKSLNGTDIILKDRKNDIYSKYGNISLCQKDCKYDYYNDTSKKVKCDCDVQNKDMNLDLDLSDFQTNEILSSFYDTLSYSNFQVLKCFTLAFDFNNFFKNIGRIIMTFILLIIIILFIIYYIKDRQKLKLYLVDIIRQKIIFDRTTNKKNLTQINPEKKVKDKKPKNNEIILTNILNLNNKEHNKANKKNKNKKNINIFNYQNSNIEIKNSINSQNKEVPSIPSVSKFKIQNNLGNIDKSESSNNIFLSKEKKKIINNKNYEFSSLKIKEKRKNSNHNKNKNNKIEKMQINYTNEELNNMKYQNALLYDKRTFFQYYWSLLKKKQLILLALLNKDDYNLVTLKISLFFISFSLYFSVNCFFFTDNTMHRIYKDNGNYDIIIQLPIMVYSTLISSIFNLIFKKFSLSEKQILEIKRENNIKILKEKAKKIFFFLKIRFLIFYILSFIFMLFFWYFISCFCAVYINTQTILIDDTLLSFGLSMIYPFGLNFLPGIFRITSLRAEKKDKECLYKISTLFSII